MRAGLLAYDDFAEVLEGELPSGRTVIIRFPDRASAKKWWDSDEYQTIANHRRAGTKTDFIIMIEDHPEPDNFS
jgi:uncharacterized protein (DUF1330 family)